MKLKAIVLRMFQNFFNMHNFHWIIPQIIYSTRTVNITCKDSLGCIDNNNIELIPRPAVLAWGAAERQYSRPRTYI
jgi:hypothetical protein